MSPAKQGEQHILLHRQWGSDDCCLCELEVKTIGYQKRIFKLEAEIERLKNQIESHRDCILMVSQYHYPTSRVAIIRRAKEELAKETFE